LGNLPGVSCPCQNPWQMSIFLVVYKPSCPSMTMFLFNRKKKLNEEGYNNVKESMKWQRIVWLIKISVELKPVLIYHSGRRKEIKKECEDKMVRLLSNCLMVLVYE
jgi:hypothetical protein